MQKLSILVLVLVLSSVVGCAASTEPVAADLDGSWSGDCVLDGVRREAGDPDEPISGGGPIEIEIASGVFPLALGEGCVLSVASDDGTTLTYATSTCEVLDGTERTAPMTVSGHATRLASGGLQLELDVFWDRVVSGWTEEYTMVCALERAR